jgi:hypothetical protein
MTRNFHTARIKDAGRRRGWEVVPYTDTTFRVIVETVKGDMLMFNYDVVTGYINEVSEKKPSGPEHTFDAETWIINNYKAYLQ